MLEALETPPRTADQFLWTDFIELRALLHPDRCYSRGDLLGLGKRALDTGIDLAFAGDGNTVGAATECATKIEKRWREISNFAQIRANDFAAAYPFRVTEDGDTLEFGSDTENQAAQQLYLDLLLASLLRYFPRTSTHEVGRFFEDSSYVVFKKLMPEGAEIRATGAGSGSAAPYQGTLFQKMQQIADDLRCTVNFKERDFKPNDTGDGGIDLISWHPMADTRNSMPIAFAQCGCSNSDWKFKQLEASPAKHYSHLPVKHPWSTYYFLPIDLRHPDGGWAYEADIGQAIIVDRLRLVRLVEQYQLYGQLPSHPLREKVMALEYT